jgi:subtilisin family serine protease/flagellar basal body-associated protein FliL
MSDEQNPIEPPPATVPVPESEFIPPSEEPPVEEPEQEEEVSQNPPEKPSFLDKLATRKGITIIAIVTALFLIVAVVVGIYFYKQQIQAEPTTYPALKNFTPPPSLSELAEKYPKYADLLKDPDLDSAYKDFLIAYEEGGVDGAIELAEKRDMINKQGELLVTLEFDTEDTTAAQDQLKEKGISIKTVYKSIMDIGIPVDMIKEQLESDDPGAIFRELTELEHVTQVRLPVKSGPNDGMNTNPEAPVYQLALESLPVINATAWHEAGFTGQGMRVGILDFGFDGYRDELGQELPNEASITARSFIAGTEIDQTGINHGTAVAEVVHAIAPDAELVFAAYASDAEFFDAINWLLSQNVSIINHSGGGAYGPRDGTGMDAEAISQVVANNILWVNSSGNSGSRHWRGEYYDSNGDGVHEFDNDGTIGLGFLPFYDTEIIVEWDDWDAKNQDLDVYVLDSDGNAIYASQNIQDGSGTDPVEGVFYEFPDSGPYYLAIVGQNVTRPVTIDVFANYADFDPSLIVPSYSILSPADADAAFTICATNWESQLLTDYSSQGPTVDGRLKPDMCGPTETYSVAFGEEFAGTSNSSPQVAGAATLIRQAFPEFTVNQIKAFLLERAQDGGPDGPDTGYGMGTLWMGDPPGEEVVITPPPTEEPGSPSETPIVVSETEEPIVKKEKKSEDNTFLYVIIASLCCVSLLFILGVILLIVLLSRKKRKPARPVPPRYPQARPPQAGGYQQPRPGAPVPPRPPAGYPPARPGTPPPAAPGMMVCPRCGTPHAPQAPSCARCGLQFGAPPQPQQPPQLMTTCRYCGQPIRQGAAFCPKCGQKQ